MKSDAKQDKAAIRAAVHAHEKAMHKGEPMTPMRHGGRAYSTGGRVRPYSPQAADDPKSLYRK